MKLLLPLFAAVLLAGCLGPLQPPTPPDDDDDVTDDDDTGPDDDDSADDDDDTAPDDDDATPLVETGATQRLCSAAGTASNGSYTVRSCTGPVEAAPGVVTNGTYTIRINKLNALAK
jgi:hypothetical protein